LKRCKAHVSDMLLNEYFIECIDILAPIICNIFNAVFNSGCYPEEWFDGIIAPLHKRATQSPWIITEGLRHSVVCRTYLHLF